MLRLLLRLPIEKESRERDASLPSHGVHFDVRGETHDASCQTVSPLTVTLHVFASTVTGRGRSVSFLVKTLSRTMPYLPPVIRMPWYGSLQSLILLRSMEKRVAA